MFLYGASGSGKSTFLNLLSGVRDSILKELVRNYFGRIEYVMHESKLLPWHNLYKNVNVINSLNGKIDLLILKTIINSMDLDEDVFQLKPWELSLGMRQRIEIAISMANNPRLMIFDEALSGIDNKCKQSLCKDLYFYIKEKNISLIATAHQISDILRLAERIIFIENGYIKDSLTVTSLCAKDRLNLDINQLYALPEARLLLKLQ